MSCDQNAAYDSMLAGDECEKLKQWISASVGTSAGVVVEIGSYRGGTTVLLAKHLNALGGGRVYAIDPHLEFEGVYGGRFSPNDCDRFRENMVSSGLSEHVTHICEKSVTAAITWDRPIDVLFVDGDHSYQGVVTDMRSWAHHIRIGGMIVFDDWFPRSEVELAAIEQIDRTEFRLFETHGKLRAYVRQALPVSVGVRAAMTTGKGKSGSAGKKVLYLAAGLQSGGTTVLSWCFLQRSDMNGVLDLPHDFLRPMPLVGTEYGWAKATIACFRYEEVAEYYRWQGWEIRPLLVVRDIRRTYASLKNKWYGVNGTTAEDPPLRLRFMRFLEDWRMFRENGWAIVRYESLVEDPSATLKGACEQLGLVWDEAMLTWPKSVSEIADAGSGNATFFKSIERGSAEHAFMPSKASQPVVGVSREDLDWIEEEFAEYESAHHYEAGDVVAVDYRLPCFEGTRRDLAQKELRETLRKSKQLQRILKHPVFGRSLRIWANVINPGLRDILNDEDAP